MTVLDKFCDCDHGMFGFCDCGLDPDDAWALTGRLDPAPLLALFADSHAAGKALRVSGDTIQRWQSGGTIRADRADVYACRIGMLPAEVWGDDWWQA